jgi:hypothetical protein
MRGATGAMPEKLAALAFTLRTYVPSLYYLGLKTRPDETIYLRVDGLSEELCSLVPSSCSPMKKGSATGPEVALAILLA